MDEEGNRIGYYTQPFSATDIAEAQRRSASETGGRTTGVVLARIQKLESE